MRLGPGAYGIWMRIKDTTGSTGDLPKWKYIAGHRLDLTPRHLEKQARQKGKPYLVQLPEELLASENRCIWEALQVGMKFTGLGVVGASGPLTLRFPGKFGTGDQFVIRVPSQAWSLPGRDWIVRI